jgi:NADPH:quinone reductase-like Zn-dependent oxidoreductase
MQAVVFDIAGEPRDALRLTEVPAPQPGEGEVLVKVTARPIQPADLAFIRGQYRLRPSFPQIAGLEGSGVVLARPGRVAIAPGTRVAFRWPGSWAEVAAVPVRRLIEMPADISDEAACQISLNPVTAWALLDEAKVGAGDCILLTAAASTVSTLVAAMARRRGIHVIGLVRGAAANGKEPVFSVEDPKLTTKIAAAAGGRGIAALLDSVGGPIIPKLFATLGAGARIVAYGVQDRAPAAITNAMLIYSNLTWKGFGIDRWLSGLPAEIAAGMLQDLWSMIREGTLTLPVASTHALASFDKALAADAQPGRKGKVLLV